MKKNQKYPKASTAFYHLYCMNFECRISVYNLNVEIKMPLTAKNLLTVHRCKCCHTPLISPIELEIKNVLTKLNANSHDRPKHLDN